jgi:hypothetical protein
VTQLVVKAAPVGDGSGALDYAADNVAGLESVVLANCVFVAKNGNDATGLRADLEKPFLTIGAAMAAAHDGDAVLAYPGFYDEDVVLPADFERLSLVGLDATTTSVRSVSWRATGANQLAAVREFSVTGDLSFDGSSATGAQTALESLYGASSLTLDSLTDPQVQDVTLSGDFTLSACLGANVSNLTAQGGGTISYISGPTGARAPYIFDKVTFGDDTFVFGEVWARGNVKVTNGSNLTINGSTYHTGGVDEALNWVVATVVDGGDLNINFAKHKVGQVAENMCDVTGGYSSGGDVNVQVVGAPDAVKMSQFRASVFRLDPGNAIISGESVYAYVRGSGLKNVQLESSDGIGAFDRELWLESAGTATVGGTAFSIDPPFPDTTNMGFCVCLRNPTGGAFTPDYVWVDGPSLAVNGFVLKSSAHSVPINVQILYDKRILGWLSRGLTRSSRSRLRSSARWEC